MRTTSSPNCTVFIRGNTDAQGLSMMNKHTIVNVHFYLRFQGKIMFAKKHFYKLNVIANGVSQLHQSAQCLFFERKLLYLLPQPEVDASPLINHIWYQSWFSFLQILWTGLSGSQPHQAARRRDLFLQISHQAIPQQLCSLLPQHGVPSSSHSTWTHLPTLKATSIPNYLDIISVLPKELKTTTKKANSLATEPLQSLHKEAGKGSAFFPKIAHNPKSPASYFKQKLTCLLVLMPHLETHV